MTRALLAVLALLPACGASAGMLFRSRFEVDAGGVLERTIEISGTVHGRLETGFDPATQSVEVLEAWTASSDGSREDLPSWAVDTLAGSDGFQSLLVAVFPPGRQGLLEIRILDSSWSWEDRLWFAVTPPAGCDSSVVEVAGGWGISWEGEDWSALRDGSDIILSAGPDAGVLRASSYRGWQDMYADLTREARALLESEQPLSVREAVIEASAGGADHTMLLARLRTLLCNSIAMAPAPPTMSAFAPAGPGTVLERRRATRMEAAVLFAAMAGSAGIEADLVLASRNPSGLPMPGEWDRILVEAGRNDRKLLYEPFAALVPAAYIPDPDGLRLLRPGSGNPVEYAPPPSDRCREAWTMSAAGEWIVEVEAGGRYDRLIRRRLAGLGAAEARVMVATMLWRSGIVSRVDSCWTGDLFDLARPASFGASLAVPCAQSSTFRLLPALAWESGGEAGDFLRSWVLPLDAETGTDLAASGGLLSDTLPSPVRRLFRIGQ